MTKIKIMFWAAAALGFAIGSAAEAQPGATPGMGQASGFAETEVSGTVTETMDASNYTYVQVNTGTRSVWAAAPRFSVKVGDRVSVPTASPMQNYRSDTLGRTFPLVYFAGKIRVATPSTGAGPGADTRSPHPSGGRAAPAPELTLGAIAKPEGGHTIGEMFDQGKSLAGTEVVIRGRVVKYSARIMGTNWLHLQDGTRGADGSNDLVVTTDDTASIGDLVLVRGAVSVDRDFGYGYKYELIVEGAKITRE